MDAFGESPKHRKITSHVHRSRRNPCVLKRCVPIVVLLVAATILGVIAGVCLASFNYMHLNDLQGVVVHEDMYQETVREFQAKLSEMTAQISSLNAEVGALSDRLEQVSSNLSTAESALREMVLINRDTITSQNDSLTILGANLRDGLDNSTRRLDDFENLTGLNVANLRNTTEGLGSQIDTLQDTISSDSVDVFGSCTVNQTLPSHLSSDELEPVYTVTTEPVLFNGTVSMTCNIVVCLHQVVGSSKSKMHGVCV